MTEVVKKDMKKWVKEYIEKEKLIQQRIDADPNAKILYTFEIDVDTLKTESTELKVLDYDEDVTGFATYEESTESNRVYAESLESENHARKLVYEFCEKFDNCLDAIKYETRIINGKKIRCDCNFEERICDCYQLSFR